MGLSEVMVSLEVISITDKPNWALSIFAYLYDSLAENLNYLIQG